MGPFFNELAILFPNLRRGALKIVTRSRVIKGARFKSSLQCFRALFVITFVCLQVNSLQCFGHSHDTSQ